MDAKEFLEQVKDISIELKVLEEEQKKIEQDIYSIHVMAFDEDKVQSGKHVDLSDKIALLEQHRMLVDEKWTQLIDVRNKVRYVIAKVKNRKARVVLIQRYILGYKWEKICAFFAKADEDPEQKKPQIYRYWKQGVDEIQKIIEQNDTF